VSDQLLVAEQFGVDGAHDALGVHLVLGDDGDACRGVFAERPDREERAGGGGLAVSCRVENQRTDFRGGGLDQPKVKVFELSKLTRGGANRVFEVVQAEEFGVVEQVLPMIQQTFSAPFWPV